MYSSPTSSGSGAGSASFSGVGKGASLFVTGAASPDVGSATFEGTSSVFCSSTAAFLGSVEQRTIFDNYGLDRRDDITIFSGMAIGPKKKNGGTTLFAILRRRGSRRKWKEINGLSA